MRILLSLLFILSNCVVSAKTYYVALNGSNSNSGTITQPYLTIQYGINKLRAGDTLFIRGGTYFPTSYIDCTSYSGTEENPICVFAYPDDWSAGNPPVIDCSNFIIKTSGFWVHDVNFWIIKGITVCHVKQLPDFDSSGRRGIVAQRAKNIYFINCVAHHNMGAGFEVIGENTSAYFINCDSYSNYDEYSTNNPGLGLPPDDAGNDADGFGNNGASIYLDPTIPVEKWTYGYYYGCRAWNNSDDGFGHAYGSIAHHENCWAIRNGYLSSGEIGHDGRGFTAGHQYCTPPDNQYIYLNCLSVYNRTAGFRVNCSGEIYTSNFKYYNNTAAFNGEYDFTANVDAGLPSHPVLYRNNIGFGHANQIAWVPTYDACFGYPGERLFPTYDHNSWDIPITITATDFLSTDSTGITGPRQIDGSLPKLNFLKLSSGSKLIDKGIDVGAPYDGTKPDLGYSEYATGQSSANQIPSVTISSPTKSSSFIAPATLTIEAVAFDPDGTITKVEFYNGNIKLGERTSSPYSYTWKEVMEGTYSLSAIAFDNLNAKTTSSTVSVTVLKSAMAINQLPVIFILSPENNSWFEAPAQITITANAYDKDGTVSKVEYFNGSKKIGGSTTSPFPITFSCPDTSTYTITAKATDNLNAISISSPVRITVSRKGESQNLINLYPNPNNGSFTVDLTPDIQDGNYQVSVVNLNGRTIFNDILVYPETRKNIDLSTAAPGQYIFILQTGRNIIGTMKFIKL